MKFISTIVAIVLCVAVTFAAPPKPSFDQFEHHHPGPRPGPPGPPHHHPHPPHPKPTFNPIGGIIKNLNKYLKELQCSQQVAGNVIGDSELTDDFNNFTAITQNLTENWSKCNLTNISDFVACKANIIQEIGEAFEEFSETVSNKNETIAAQISTQIQEQCVRKPWGSESNETSANDLPDRYQCMADVLGEASKANNMNATWTEIQPELQLHIDSWKECDQDGNKYTVFACYAKEEVATYIAITTYLRDAAIQKPIWINFAHALCFA